MDGTVKVFSAINVIGGQVRHAGALNADTGAIEPVCRRPMVDPRVITDDRGFYVLGPVTCYCCLVALGVVRHRGGRPRKPRALCTCGKPVKSRGRKHCSPECQYATLRGQVYSSKPAAVAKRARVARRRSRSTPDDK